MIANSDDKINFPHKLLLTNSQAENLCKALTNNSSCFDIKLSKTQLIKDHSIRRISWQNSWSIIKNRTNINEKCN